MNAVLAHQYLQHDYFHFRRSDRSTIADFSAHDSHPLLYPFVDEGAEDSVTDIKIVNTPNTQPPTPGIYDHHTSSSDDADDV
jgi:hypothetical protein